MTWLKRCNEFLTWKDSNSWKRMCNRFELLCEFKCDLNENELMEKEELYTLLSCNENYLNYLEEKNKKENEIKNKNNLKLVIPTFDEDINEIWNEYKEKFTNYSSIELYYFITHLKEYIDDLKNKTIKHIQKTFCEKYENTKNENKSDYKTFYYEVINFILAIENEGYLMKNIKPIYIKYLEEKLDEIKQLHSCRVNDKNEKIKNNNNERLKQKVICECCKIEVAKRNWSRHLTSKIHQENS